MAIELIVLGQGARRTLAAMNACHHAMLEMPAEVAALIDSILTGAP
jgi:hypothetical protein